MPDPRTTSGGEPKPTGKQLAFLRRLAERTGQTFSYPRTRAEASAEINRLCRQPATPRADRVRERRQVADDLVTRTGGATRIRQSEIDGYGSTATWGTAR